MKKSTILVALAAGFTALVFCTTVSADEWLSGIKWNKPPIIKPGSPGAPPSDAVVLFDGTRHVAVARRREMVGQRRHCYGGSRHTGQQACVRRLPGSY